MGLRVRWLRRWAWSEEAGLLASWFGFWAICARFQTYERITELMARHEGWQLDELLLGFSIAGALAVMFFVRRGLRLAAAAGRSARAETRAQWLSLHDPLTGLYNRRQLDLWLAEGRGRAVLCIDLDRFKQINTLAGHEGGDAMLTETARRLERAAPGCRIARAAGDEFLVIVDGDADPMAVAARIVDLQEEPVLANGVRLRACASVGIALVPEDAPDLAAAAPLADAALYEAKRKGRGQAIRFAPAMQDELRRRAELERALRDALQKGAIRPHYQPLIDLPTGAIVGFEALARWRSEDGPAPGPGEFIPVAEETGMISELTDQLFRLACRDARGWPDEMSLSFNISPVQLTDPTLVERLLRTLEEEGLPATRLQVEITESAMAENVELGRRIVEALRAAGARVAIDDFGTGYSSLSQLAQLGFDAIKIDRSFVSGDDADGVGREILKAILGLSRGLGVAATAEGVETAAQLARLRALGCDRVQGYLFSPAVSAEETAAMGAARSVPMPRAG